MLSPFARRKMALGFYRLDPSKDGLVSQDDLASLGQQVVAQLQIAPGSAQADRVIQAFVNLWNAYGRSADKDGDNAISFEEFVEAQATFLQTPNAREVGVGINAAVFAALDLDNDGQIDAQEYTAFLRPMGVATSEAQTAFQHLDRNGDGFLSREEAAADWWEYWNAEDRTVPGNWFYGTF
jgi:Ca2+-binding EF-hand superfamily protein